MGLCQIMFYFEPSGFVCVHETVENGKRVFKSEKYFWCVSFFEVQYCFIFDGNAILIRLELHSMTLLHCCWDMSSSNQNRDWRPCWYSFIFVAHWYKIGFGMRALNVSLMITSIAASFKAFINLDLCKRPLAYFYGYVCQYESQDAKLQNSSWSPLLKYLCFIKYTQS